MFNTDYQFVIKSISLLWFGLCCKYAGAGSGIVTAICAIRVCICNKHLCVTLKNEELDSLKVR